MTQIRLMVSLVFVGFVVGFLLGASTMVGLRIDENPATHVLAVLVGAFIATIVMWGLFSADRMKTKTPVQASED